MLRLLLVSILLMLTQCGLVSELGLHSGDKCLSKIPDDVVAKNKASAETTNTVRLQVVESERNRLSVSPVVFNANIHYSTAIENSPYPKATPVFLDSASSANVHAGHFSQFHGTEGARTVYETEPGSKLYFIVDEVSGDGAGSIYMTQYVAGVGTEGSMHSWHVSKENRLVRARVNPIYVNSSEIKFCGCGTHSHLRGNAKYDMMAQPSLGIFMLPGTTVPVLDTEEMNIQYIDESIKIHSVDPEGNDCPQPVC